MNIKSNNLIIFLLSAIVILLALYVFQWRTTNMYNKEIYIQNQAMDNILKKFVYYQDANVDISLENLDSCTFSTKNILIYRFAEDMCDECIQQDLKELYSFQQIVGKHRVLILPAYDEKRNNHIFLSNILAKFKFKNISDSIIGFPIHRKSGEFARYMAYVDANGKITSIFYPTKFERSLTQIFLHVMECKFEKDRPISSQEKG